MLRKYNQQKITKENIHFAFIPEYNGMTIIQDESFLVVFSQHLSEEQQQKIIQEILGG